MSPLTQLAHCLGSFHSNLIQGIFKQEPDLPLTTGLVESLNLHKGLFLHFFPPFSSSSLSTHLGNNFFGTVSMFEKSTNQTHGYYKSNKLQFSWTCAENRYTAEYVILKEFCKSTTDITIKMLKSFDTFTRDKRGLCKRKRRDILFETGRLLIWFEMLSVSNLLIKTS